MEEIGLFFLIKFGRKEYMDKLFKYGEIYMSNITKIREIEDNQLRGDKDEGVIGIEQIGEFKLLIKDLELGRSNLAQLKFHDLENRGNLYCMTAITTRDNPDSFKIDDKNKDFGDSFVVITKVEDFIERIGKKFKELRREYKHGLVNYYGSKKYSGPLNVFWKSDDFSYQKEFRFWVKRDEPCHLKIEIGSIEDISFIFDIDKLDKIGISFTKDGEH